MLGGAQCGRGHDVEISGIGGQVMAGPFDLEQDGDLDPGQFLAGFGQDQRVVRPYPLELRFLLELGFGDMEPYLQIVYSRIPGAANENKGDYKMWESGGNARTGGTSDEAVRIISMMSWKSLEVRRRNAFLVMRKAA